MSRSWLKVEKLEWTFVIKFQTCHGMCFGKKI